MSLYDLTTVEQVSNWAGSSVTNIEQVRALISSTSAQILADLSRQAILPFIYSEMADTQGSRSVMLREYPVQSVSSVVIDGCLIPPGSYGSAGVAPVLGWLLSLADPFPPGRPQILSAPGYFGYRGGFGRGNRISVSYTAGYQTAETWTVPAVAPFQIRPVQALGLWGSDVGVTYMLSGTPLAAVFGKPTAGQYAVSDGVYTFAAADAGLSVTITYGFIPRALAQACAQWVAELVSYSGRIGKKSQSLGGQETMTYDTAAIPARVAAMIQPYKRVAMI